MFMIKCLKNRPVTKKCTNPKQEAEHILVVDPLL